MMLITTALDASLLVLCSCAQTPEGLATFGCATEENSNICNSGKFQAPGEAFRAQGSSSIAIFPTLSNLLTTVLEQTHAQSVEQHETE